MSCVVGNLILIRLNCQKRCSVVFFLLSVKSHVDLSMRWWKGSIVKLVVRNCILKKEYRSLSVFWKRRQCEDVPYLLLDVMLHHRHTKHVHGQLTETLNCAWAKAVILQSCTIKIGVFSIGKFERTLGI